MNKLLMEALRLIRSSNSSSTKPSFAIVTLPTPVLRPNSVLVRVRAASISPSDVVNAHGGFPCTTHPRISGHDDAGVVISCHADYVDKENLWNQR